MRRPTSRWMQPSIDRKTSAEKAVVRLTLIEAGMPEWEAERLADTPGFTQLDADLLALCQDGAA